MGISKREVNGQITFKGQNNMFKQSVESKTHYLEVRQGFDGSGNDVWLLQGYSKITGEKIFEKFNSYKELLNWIKYSY